MKRVYPLRYKLAAAVFIPVSLLLAAEIAVRLVGAGLTQRSTEHLPRWVLANVRDRAFTPDARLFWRPVKSSAWLHTNAYGMRGEEISRDKPPRTYRIICLGDSITWGFSLIWSRSYPYVLQQKLNNLPIPVAFEVLNAGVPGYSSLQGRRYLDELWKFQPDCVTIMFGRNDQRRLRDEGGTLPDSQVPVLPEWVNLLRRGLGQSQLFGLLRSLLTERQLHPDEVPQQTPADQARVNPAEFRVNLSEMITAARQNGSDAVLLTSARIRAPLPNYNEVVREVAASTGAPLADAAAEFEQIGIPALVVDDCHPNERGARLIAEILATVLLANNIGSGTETGAWPLTGITAGAAACPEVVPVPEQ